MIGATTLTVGAIDPGGNPTSLSSGDIIESNTDETVHLRLFNSDGKLMWRKTTFVTTGANAQYFSDLQSLPKGIYYIKVDRTNTTTEIKLIKQ